MDCVTSTSDADKNYLLSHEEAFKNSIVFEAIPASRLQYIDAEGITHTRSARDYFHDAFTRHIEGVTKEESADFDEIVDGILANAKMTDEDVASFRARHTELDGSFKDKTIQAKDKVLALFETQGLLLQTSASRRARALAVITLGDIAGESTGASLQDFVLSYRRIMGVKHRPAVRASMDSYLKTVGSRGGKLSKYVDRLDPKLAKAETDAVSRILESFRTGVDLDGDLGKVQGSIRDAVVTGSAAYGLSPEIAKGALPNMIDEIIRDAVAYDRNFKGALRNSGMSPADVDDFVSRLLHDGDGVIDGVIRDDELRKVLGLLSVSVDDLFNMVVNKQAMEYGSSMLGFPVSGFTNTPYTQFKKATQDMFYKEVHNEYEAEIFKEVLDDLGGKPPNRMYGGISGAVKHAGTALMGATAGISSVTDTIHIAARYGVQKVLINTAKQFPRLFHPKNKDALFSELEKYGYSVSMENEIFGQMSKIGGDVNEFGEVSTSSWAKNVWRSLPSAAMAVGGANRIPTMQRTALTRQMIDDLRTGDYSKLFKGNGMSQEVFDRVSAQIKKHGDVDTLNLHKWDDVNDMQAMFLTFERSMRRDVYQFSSGDGLKFTTNNPTARDLMYYLNSATGSFEQQGRRTLRDSSDHELWMYAVRYSILGSLYGMAREGMSGRDHEDPASFLAASANRGILSAMPILFPASTGLNLFSGETIDRQIVLKSVFDRIQRAGLSGTDLLLNDGSADTFGKNASGIIPMLNHPFVQLLQTLSEAE